MVRPEFKEMSWAPSAPEYPEVLKMFPMSNVSDDTYVTVATELAAYEKLVIAKEEKLTEMFNPMVNEPSNLFSS